MLEHQQMAAGINQLGADEDGGRRSAAAIMTMMRPNYSSPGHNLNEMQGTTNYYGAMNNTSNSNDFNRLDTLVESRMSGEDRRMLRTELQTCDTVL